MRMASRGDSMTRNWRPVVVLLGVMFTIAHGLGSLILFLAVMFGAMGANVGRWVATLFMVITFPVNLLIPILGGVLGLPAAATLALMVANSVLWGTGLV